MIGRNVDLQGESNESYEWNGPPIHLGCHSKGEDTAKEGESLFVVDSEGLDQFFLMVWEARFGLTDELLELGQGG